MPRQLEQLKLTAKNVHDTVDFLLNDSRNEKMDWSWLYSLFSTPLHKGDCSDMCCDQISPQSFNLHKFTGSTKAWCCNVVNFGGVRLLPLMGESEADYLTDLIGSDSFFLRDYKGKGINFLCYNAPCPREVRPFWCRIYPFFPLLSADGKIVGVWFANQRTPSTAGCMLKWRKEFSPLFLKGWEVALRNVDIRKNYRLFLVAETSAIVYPMLTRKENDETMRGGD